MTTEPLFTPQDAAGRIGISSSYLRRLALDWPQFLSDYANPTGSDPRSRRRMYTAQDIATISAILDLQRRGVEDADIPAQLAVDPPEAPPAVEAQPETPQAPESASRAIMALTGAIAQDQAQRLAAVEAQLADLRVQVARLEAMMEAHRHRSKPFGGETTGPV